MNVVYFLYLSIQYISYRYFNFYFGSCIEIDIYLALSFIDFSLAFFVSHDFYLVLIFCE